MDMNIDLREQKLHELERDYPKKEGWKIVEMGGSSLKELYSYLQNKHPDAIKVDQVIPWRVGEYERDHNAFGLTAKELGKVTYETVKWYGQLEVEWKHEFIIFCRFPYDGGDYASNTVTFIVSKSQSAVEDLRSEILFYCLDESKLKNEILVVGGRGMPLPKTNWNELFLPEGMADSIQLSVESFFSAKESYRELAVPYKRGFIFVGPPGNGKTQTIRAIAANIKKPVVYIPVSAGLEEKDVAYGVREAQDLSPSILVLEDLDKILSNGKVSLSYLLNLIDGLRVVEGMLIIATSNEPEKIDPALLKRPSRFDRIWQFPLPGFNQRFSILSYKGSKYFSKVAIIKCAQETQGFSMAYVQEVIINALLQSVHHGEKPGDSDLMNSLVSIKRQHREVDKGLPDMNANGEVGFVNRVINNKLSDHLEDL